jgi:hypothetical protein
MSNGLAAGCGYLMTLGKPEDFVMDLKNPNTIWIESLFDVSQPYVYVLVLPALVLFALGFRSQAVVFSLGAAAFFTFLGVT